MKIVGIGGLPRSGKDTVAELFIERGWFGVSVGDIVREESRKRHASEPDPVSVKNMTETSNYLRTTYGPDVVLVQAIDRFKKASETQSYRGLMVWSIRMPVEVDFILGKGGELIWVEANDEIRLERANQHRREGEPEHTLELMKSQEALQQKPQPGLPEEVQMNIDYVKSHATKILTNNGDDVEAFKREAEETLELAD